MKARWQPDCGQNFLSDNTIGIWQIPLDIDPDQQKILEKILSPEEISRAHRFIFEHDQRHYIAAHAVVRQILGRFCRCYPQEVCFRTASSGKPGLVGPNGLYFNLTHSKGMALLAVTGAGEVGIDIEAHRPLDDMNHLAQECFSEQEYQDFQTLPIEQRQIVFFNVWTRKEAYIKALGNGLSYPLDQFSVSVLPDQPCRLREDRTSPQPADDWTIQEIETKPGYSAAFAVLARDVRVYFWSYCYLWEGIHVI